jgi:uncharacterized protein YegP (UPF0339 family)
MAAKFVVKKGKTGMFASTSWPTTKVIATSEVYETKRACLAGVESVRKNAGEAVLDDRA